MKSMAGYLYHCYYPERNNNQRSLQTIYSGCFFSCYIAKGNIILTKYVLTKTRAFNLSVSGYPNSNKPNHPSNNSDHRARQILAQLASQLVAQTDLIQLLKQEKRNCLCHLPLIHCPVEPTYLPAVLQAKPTAQILGLLLTNNGSLEYEGTSGGAVVGAILM